MRRAGLVLGLVLLLAGLGMAGCGGGSDGGPVTLRWYVFREPGGSFAEAAKRCGRDSGGRYRVEIEQLPADASAQREQLVRRLAAEDSDIDLIGMDVIWTAEFARAGWIAPWTGARAREVVRGAIPATADTARFDGGLWAAPFTTNAQLLWYRKDRVAAPPATWDEMIDAAERIGRNGRIQVQGARYEGLTVWFASLLASAGGDVVTGDQAEDPRVALGPPAVEAARVMRDLARSSAADPSLANGVEDTTRLAFESGRSSFMVNYPFVFPSARENAPDVFRNMGWARWPRVRPDRPSRVTLGGVNIGVGAFSEHTELAFEAASCLVKPRNQLLAVTRGGLPPTNQALYDHPRVREVYPFADVLLAQLRDATTRPATPAYNDVSLAIQSVLHPPRDIDPEDAIEELRDTVERVITSGGLL